jgi:hypothetical protein
MLKAVYVIRIEIFMAVKIQAEVFSVVMPCGVIVEYQRFKVPSCLHLQEAA